MLAFNHSTILLPFTPSPSRRQINGIITNIYLPQPRSLSWAVVYTDRRRHEKTKQALSLPQSCRFTIQMSSLHSPAAQASSIQQAPCSEQDCSLLCMSHSLLQRPSPLTDLPLSNRHVHLLFRRNINLFMSQNRFQVPHPVSNKIPPAKLLFSQPGLN